MKILQVSAGRERIPVAKGGGIETVIFNISKHMVKHGEDVTILDRKRIKEDLNIDHVDNISITRLKCIQFKLNKRMYFISTIINELFFSLSVSRYIKRTKSNFDTIHFHDPFIGTVLLILNGRLMKKMFYTTHQPLWSLEKPSILLRLIYMNLEKFIMCHITTNVPNSYLKSKVEKITMSKNIISIPNGIDTEVFNPDNNVDNIKKLYNMEGIINILFVGRFYYTKGIEYLIKAADIIINKHKYSVQFVLVGPYGKNDVTVPMSDHKKILDLIEKFKIKNSINMTGVVSFEDLKKLYIVSDICVVPSLAEMYALVTLEAMSSGKPIVATNIAGPCITDGINGFVVESGNEVQLAEKIKYLIDYPEERKRMSINGRKIAETTFDWKNISDMYLNAYNVIGEK